MGWYNASWNYRIKITVDNTKVDADLTDFPVYVDLANLPAGFFSNVKADGGDIRVTKSDGETEVPREVVSISTGSSTGELHFKAAGTLSSASDTDFYIYYGNAAASEPAVTDTYGRNNTWNSGYVMVMHLQETVNTTAGGYKDATSNANNGTGVSMSLTAPAAKIGKGQDFDGNADYITIANHASLQMSNTITIEGWVDIDVSKTAGLNQYLVDKLNYYSVIVEDDEKISFYGRNLSTPIATTTAAISLNTLSYLATAYDKDAGANNLRIFPNTATPESFTRTNALGTSANVVRLATYSAGTGSPFALDGLIDEVRLSNVARSTEYIAASYNNQNSPGTFYTPGTQEVNPDMATEQPAIFFGMNF
jgi:hypothetical protein